MLPLVFLPDSDYLFNAELVEFEPGQSTVEVFVTILDDNILENTEMFSAILTPIGTNVLIEDGRDTAEITINDDDREWCYHISM